MKNLVITPTYRVFFDQVVPVLIPPETVEGFRGDQTLQGMGSKREGDAGRGERIRTSDSCVPNAVLYQAELHPDEMKA
jgi:hypothetical protein